MRLSRIFGALMALVLGAFASSSQAFPVFPSRATIPAYRAGANTYGSYTTGLQLFGAEVLKRLRAKVGFITRIQREIPGGDAVGFGKAGNTINIPVISIAGGMNTRTSGGGTTQDDAAITSVSASLTHVYKAISAIDNLDQALTNVNLFDNFAEQMAQILAEGIEGQIYALWKTIPYQVGKTDGTAAFNATDNLLVLAQAAKVALDNHWLANNGDRWAVLSSAEGQNLKSLQAFTNANQAGNNMQRETGQLGRILGWNLDEANTPASQTLTTAAVWGTPLVNGANALGSTTLAVKGLAATGTIKAGSIFTVGGYAYTCTADATITTNTATLTLNTPLKGALTDGTAITATTHSAAGGISLAFDPAFAVFTTRRMAPFAPGSGVLEVPISDPVTGVNFRLLVESAVQGSAGSAFTTKLTMDALIATATLRPELACRIAGQ